MFKKQRAARREKQRHEQFMRIAGGIVQSKDAGPTTHWDYEEIARIFLGQVYSRRHEVLEFADAALYISAALAERGFPVDPEVIDGAAVA
ncbi:hypothetical protein [Streptomyces tremellae]|uniref:Uncharacterized protein n=1 Tax=Streptomyces tremellae TaxID=1124239 RepID=A0ABP7G409_9ACTN